MKIDKEYFTKIINNLQKQAEHDSKCSDAFSVILPNDYVSLYDNSILFDTIINMLKVYFNDKFNWIEYYIYDLDYGKKYYHGCVKIHDEPIDISTPEKLYDFLLLNQIKL